ncbi:hypothetical protein TrLO_g4932 [Triparma laevis f. longispina]|nr:hypothetical protein TrLO_g4932 [Triparma laevis f. longispina]
MSDFADDIDGSRLGGWALFSYGVGVFALIILLGWGATRLRPPQEEEEIETEEWLYVPSIDYLLEVFDYNINEDRVFGQLNHSWPLEESVRSGIERKLGDAMDWAGVAKGNFDRDLSNVIDDFRLTEEAFGEEKDNAPVAVEKPAKVDEDNVKKFKYGHVLPFVYANFIKNVCLIFTFGLASPLVAWIGCGGLLCWWLAFSFIAERWEAKSEERAKNGQAEIKSDAQGIPFRCIVLVVVCNMGFIAAASLLAQVDSDEDKVTGWPVVLLVVMLVSLCSQMIYLGCGDRLRRFGVSWGKPEEVGDVGGVGADNSTTGVVCSPMQDGAGDEEDGGGIEMSSINI